MNLWKNKKEYWEINISLTDYYIFKLKIVKEVKNGKGFDD